MEGQIDEKLNEPATPTSVSDIQFRIDTAFDDDILDGIPQSAFFYEALLDLSESHTSTTQDVFISGGLWFPGFGLFAEGLHVWHLQRVYTDEPVFNFISQK